MKIEPASIEERPEVSTKEEKTNSDKRIILLVDDAPADIQAAQNILKDTYIIKTATSGVRALDLSKTTPQPDLILLDAMMPEMDGYEVCSRLKADVDTCDIPVIFLTGKTSAEVRTEDLKSEPLITFTNHFHLLWFRRVFGHTLRSAKLASSWRKKSVKWMASSKRPNDSLA